MPRIAVALAVLALIAFSIGFNTARYSVVWEMVGDSPQLSQPSKPSRSAASPQSTAIARAQASVQSTASWDSPRDEAWSQDPAGEYSYGNSWAEHDMNEDAATSAEEETEYEYSYDYAAQSPEEEAGPSDAYSARVAPAEDSAPSVSITRVVSVSAADVRQDRAGARDLVPIERLSPLAPLVGRGAGSEGLSDTLSGHQVRRLPPVDRVSPFTGDRHAPGSPDDPIRVHPSSGI